MVKKFLLILLTLILLVSCVGCHQDPPPATPNVLVVYFSATGTTRRVAEEVARVLNCDIFEIQPEQPYTEEDLDYTNSQSNQLHRAARRFCTSGNGKRRAGHSKVRYNIFGVSPLVWAGA